MYYSLISPTMLKFIWNRTTKLFETQEIFPNFKSLSVMVSDVYSNDCCLLIDSITDTHHKLINLKASGIFLFLTSHRWHLHVSTVKCVLLNARGRQYLLNWSHPRTRQIVAHKHYYIIMIMIQQVGIQEWCMRWTIELQYKSVEMKRGYNFLQHKSIESKLSQKRP
jgi:hypothetical protein